MANTVYNDAIVEARAKDLLFTNVNARTLMTIDTSMVNEPGTIKKINTYTYSGVAEELNERQGNSKVGGVSFITKDYEVKTVQQHFDFTDEDINKDPAVVDMLTQGAVQTMANKMTSDFYAEAKKATKAVNFATTINYESVVDAIAELNIEDESKLFIVMPNSWLADLRKDKAFEAANAGAILFNGQIGSIAGIPVVLTKALTDVAYVMTKEAVELFIKKDMGVEQDRDPDKRINDVYLRAFYVVALVDDGKICAIKKKA